MFCCLTLFAAATAVVTSASGVDIASDDLHKIVQSVVSQKAYEYNCSIAAAIHFHDGSKVAAIAGAKDYDKGQPATLADQYVWGSVTKTLTGTNILKAQEEGLLKISDPAAQYVDPILSKMAAKDPSMNFSSLTDLFGNQAGLITIEELARMRSGVPDYDTATPNPPTDSFRKSCYANQDRDYRPQDMLGVPWVAKGQLDFAPGTGYAYSSTNFVLLGLVLAQVYNSTWETFDQGALIPSAAKVDTSFAVTGCPANFTGMHGYDRTSYNGQDPTALPGIDVSDVHCVYAGWTASDYTASVQDAADLVYDMYGPDSPILSEASQKIRVCQWLIIVFCVRCGTLDMRVTVLSVLVVLVSFGRSRSQQNSTPLQLSTCNISLG